MSNLVLRSHLFNRQEVDGNRSFSIFTQHEVRAINLHAVLNFVKKEEAICRAQIVARFCIISERRSDTHLHNRWSFLCKSCLFVYGASYSRFGWSKMTQCKKRAREQCKSSSVKQFYCYNSERLCKTQNRQVLFTYIG